VKNFESHTASLLCGLPFIQLQSAKAKGTVGGSFAGLAAGVSLDACAAETAGLGLFASGTASDSEEAAAVAAPVAGADSVALTAGAVAAASRLFSSASSCSMRAFITASSLAISNEISASVLATGWAAAGWAAAGAVVFVAPVSSGNGSRKTATSSERPVASESARNSAHPDQSRDSRQLSGGRQKPQRAYAIEFS